MWEYEKSEFSDYSAARMNYKRQIYIDKSEEYKYYLYSELEMKRRMRGDRICQRK